MTPLTKAELDSFYHYASDCLGDDALSIEECLLRWRSGSGVSSNLSTPVVDPAPFPGQQTLKDRLEASGVLGGGSNTLPEDLSTAARHMEGFGEP